MEESVKNVAKRARYGQSVSLEYAHGSQDPNKIAEAGLRPGNKDKNHWRANYCTSSTTMSILSKCRCRTSKECC